MTRFVKLACNGNPNILDYLHLNHNDMIFCTPEFNNLRKHASYFYSHKMISCFIGYYFNHFKSMYKIGNKGEKRKALIEKYGYDVKDCSHAIRTMLNLIDIMTGREYSLDRYCEYIKNIRSGKYSLNDISIHTQKLEREFTEAKLLNLLPLNPDIVSIRKLIKDCLV